MCSVSLILLCLLSIVSCDDALFDNRTCGYPQSDNWRASSSWLAFIIVLDKVSENLYTRCAGTLINHKYILTTASCLTPEEGTILLGAQLNITEKPNYSARPHLKNFFGFEGTVIHPHYNANTGQNDIGLIRLSRPVIYSTFLQPICLPSQQSAPGNSSYTNSWIKTFASYPTQKIKAPSSLTFKCPKKIEAAELKNDTTEVYDGYIGDPFISVKNNQHFLQAILISTIGCAGLSPGIYMSISEHLNWIAASANANYNQCVTPDGENSVCVPFDTCPVLLKAFANPKKEHEAFLKEFICSNDTVGGFQVCCPTSLNPSLVITDDEGLDKLSDKRSCGYQQKDAFPWLADIRAIGLGNTEFSICSGSLINNRYVLTSAYCLIHSTQITSVRLGEFHKTDEDFGIDEIVTHPFFNYWTYSNDIALIRLKKYIFNSDYIRPICLPMASFKTPVINNTLYTTSVTAPKPWASPTLKTLFYSVVENSNRQNMQTVSEYKLRLVPLAEDVESRFYCYDDDGAPAMSSQNKQWILNGITTERVSLCNGGESVVATNISSYLLWIQENMRL